MSPRIYHSKRCGGVSYGPFRARERPKSLPRLADSRREACKGCCMGQTLTGPRPAAKCQRWVFMTQSVPVVQRGTFWSVFSSPASCPAWFFQLDLLPVVELPVSVAVLLIWLQPAGFMTVLYEPWEIALLVWIILSLSPLIIANICFHDSSKPDFPWGRYQ